MPSIYCLKSQPSTDPRRLRVGRIGSYAVTSFNLLIGGAELLVILLLGKLPAVAALYERCGLTLFAAVPLTTGFTLRTTLIFLYVGTVVAGVGFLLMTKITEYTSATEASFIYLLKPVLATARPMPRDEPVTNATFFKLFLPFLFPPPPFAASSPAGPAR